MLATLLPQIAITPKRSNMRHGHPTVTATAVPTRRLSGLRQCVIRQRPSEGFRESIGVVVVVGLQVRGVRTIMESPNNNESYGGHALSAIIQMTYDKINSEVLVALRHDSPSTTKREHQ